MTGSVGDVTASEAYDQIKREPKAQVVDVRTRAEWSFVGVPDLSADRQGGHPGGVAALSRHGEVASDFVANLERELAGAASGRTTRSTILCRSGARSLAAAQAMTAAGWGNGHNISGGFEGPPDPERHRGKIGGWKAPASPGSRPEISVRECGPAREGLARMPDLCLKSSIDGAAMRSSETHCTSSDPDPNPGLHAGHLLRRDRRRGHWAPGWDRVKRRLRVEFGEDVFSSWFARLDLDADCRRHGAAVRADAVSAQLDPGALPRQGRRTCWRRSCRGSPVST